MASELDGSGIYRQDAILGPFDEDKDVGTVIAPQIEEVRAVRYDGETYVNVNDLEIAMLMVAFRTFPTLSMLNFIKTMMANLQGGDHD